MQRNNFIAGGIIVLITVVCVTVGSTLEQAVLGWIVAAIVSILMAVLGKYSPEERILAGGFFILTFLVWFSSNRPLALLIGAAFSTVSFYEFPETGAQKIGPLRATG